MSRAESRRTRLKSLRFLKRIQHEISKKLDIHLVAADGSEGEHAPVGEWVARRKGSHVCFRVTSPYWTSQARAVYSSGHMTALVSVADVSELTEAITTHRENRAEGPRPCRWLASGGQILVTFR